MKNILTLLLILIFGASTIAQGIFRNQTNSTLEKVIQDYPSKFKNIKGELLSTAQGAAEYKSIIAIPGAILTTITQSAAAHKQQLCWQSVVYAGSAFNQAKNRFEELFNQIKNTIIKSEGGKSLIVNGLYTNPLADKTVNRIQFDLLPATGTMQKLNIDLVMKNANGQWKIILRVYDNDRNETETVVVK